MKRVISVLLTVIIALSGCGLDSPVVEKERIEIDFWYGLEGNLGDSVEVLIKDFNESQDEILVKGYQQVNYAETLRSLEIAIATNTAPSIVLLERRGILTLMSKNGLKDVSDVITSQSEIMDEEFIEGEVTLADIPPEFIDLFKEEDNIYGIPFYATVWISYFRDDFVKDNDSMVVDPLTFQDVIGNIKDTNEKEGTDLQLSFVNDDTTLINAALSNGGKVLSDNQKTVLFDTSEWIEVWEQFRIWIHEDKVIKYHDKNLGWDDYYEVLNDVKSGTAVGCVSSVSDRDLLMNEGISPYLHLGWNGEAKPVTYSLALTIPKTIEGEEEWAAKEWINYLTHEEVDGKWITMTGYLPGNINAYESQVFTEYSKENDWMNVSRDQLKSTTMPYSDPTGGVINELVTEAAYRLINDNVPAETVLKEAAEKAQQALDQLED